MTLPTGLIWRNPTRTRSQTHRNGVSGLAYGQRYGQRYGLDHRGLGAEAGHTSLKGVGITEQAADQRNRNANRSTGLVSADSA
jgi:hypothetical protein